MRLRKNSSNKPENKHLIITPEEIGTDTTVEIQLVELATWCNIGAAAHTVAANTAMPNHSRIVDPRGWIGNQGRGVTGIS